MIYLIEAVGSDRVKIGFAAESAKARRRELQCGCPFALLLLATIEGTRAGEKMLHRRFAAYRHGGEWFEKVQAILEHFGVEPEPSGPVPSELLTIERTAHQISIGPNLIIKEILAGWLKPTPWGGKWYVEVDELRRWFLSFRPHGRRDDAPRFPVGVTRGQLLGKSSNRHKASTCDASR